MAIYAKSSLSKNMHKNLFNNLSTLKKDNIMYQAIGVFIQKA
jgi:hypothetical protein